MVWPQKCRKPDFGAFLFLKVLQFGHKYSRCWTQEFWGLTVFPAALLSVFLSHLRSPWQHSSPAVAGMMEIHRRRGEEKFIIIVVPVQQASQNVLAD